MNKKRKVRADGKEITLTNGNKVFVGKLSDKRLKRYPFAIRFYNVEKKRAIVLGISKQALFALEKLIFEMRLK